jgi:hypothetical protein
MFRRFFKCLSKIIYILDDEYIMVLLLKLMKTKRKNIEVTVHFAESHFVEGHFAEAISPNGNFTEGRFR